MMTHSATGGADFHDAWETARERSGPGSFTALAEDLPAESCVGQLAQLLRPGPEDQIGLCQHVMETRGRIPWFRTLEDPDLIVCAECLSPGYITLLQKPLVRVRLRCSCCRALRWLAGPVCTRRGIGTALGVLCGDCSAQRPAGAVFQPAASAS